MVPTQPIASSAEADGVDRRTVLESLFLAGAALLVAGRADATPDAGAQGEKVVLKQDLPDVALKGWQLTALDLTYAPGQSDKPHKHPGFVFGFVIDGEVKFQVDGGKETTYKAGQMFYEPPGGVHRVSANASATRTCRFLALIFADKTSPLTTPAE